jgi:hypothetical protein
MLDRIEQNAKTVDQLRCAGSDEAEALADKLDACRPNARCANAACLVCGAGVQQPFIGGALSIWPAGTPLVHITVMPSVPRRAIGSLNTVDMREVAQHLRDLLSAAGHPSLKGIAFIDLSHSIDRCSNHEAWYPHYHMVAGERDTTDLTDRFRGVLAPTLEVRRPVKRVKLNDPARQLHYISKPRPVRVTRFDKPGATVHPLKQWLKAREHIEATLWLGRYSVMDRFIALPGPVRSFEARRKPRSA